MQMKTALLALIVWIVAGGIAAAESPAISLGYFNKLAMNGYDVMTYWKGGEPKEGNPEIAADYRGATWIFVNEDNRAAFLADPEAYAPRYGGYCAYAASQEQVSNVDPFAWHLWRQTLSELQFARSPHLGQRHRRQHCQGGYDLATPATAR